MASPLDLDLDRDLSSGCLEDLIFEDSGGLNQSIVDLQMAQEENAMAREEIENPAGSLNQLKEFKKEIRLVELEKERLEIELKRKNEENDRRNLALEAERIDKNKYKKLNDDLVEKMAKIQSDLIELQSSDLKNRSKKEKNLQRRLEKSGQNFQNLENQLTKIRDFYQDQLEKLQRLHSDQEKTERFLRKQVVASQSETDVLKSQLFEKDEQAGKTQKAMDAYERGDGLLKCAEALKNLDTYMFVLTHQELYMQEGEVPKECQKAGGVIEGLEHDFYINRPKLQSEVRKRLQEAFTFIKQGVKYRYDEYEYYGAIRKLVAFRNTYAHPETCPTLDLDGATEFTELIESLKGLTDNDKDLIVGVFKGICARKTKKSPQNQLTEPLAY